MSSLTFASATDDDIFSGLSKPITKSQDTTQKGETSGLIITQPKPKQQQLISMNSGSDSAGTSGLFALGKAQPVEVKTLNAKKLDVNFDNDDFFNSF